MNDPAVQMRGLEANNAMLKKMASQFRDALIAIKTRIGDVEKLQGNDKAQGRKWALQAVWDIAHAELIKPFDPTG